MRSVAVIMSMVPALTLCAGTVIDFSAASDMSWHVWAGGFKDADVAQISFDDSGMRVKIDSARTHNAKRMVASGPRRKPEVTGSCRLRMTVHADRGVDVRGLSLGLVDSQGEKFEFFPVDVVKDKGDVILDYEIFDNAWRDGFRGSHPLKGRTQGRNRNDHLDFPVKLDILYARLNEGFTKGDVTFRRLSSCLSNAGAIESEAELFAMSGISDPSDWKKYGPIFWDGECWTVTGGCSVAAIEYVRFPGLKPVVGMDEIRVRTTRAYPGGVVEVRAVNASTRKKHSFKMPWKQETCIPVGLAGGCPWQVDMLTFWLPPSSRTNIDFKVAAVRGIRRTSKAEAVVAEIDTGNELHLMESGSSGMPEVVLLNTSQTDISACGVLRTRDFYGEGADVPFAVALSAGERKAVGLPGEFGKGMWRVICDLTADDGSIASSTLRFAVIGGGKPGRVWKGREKFRVGICYHPVYYSERERTAALNAMTLAGVKLARINGFQFSRCWKSEKVFDWSCADSVLDAHLSRGISVSAGIYMSPEWARKPYETREKNSAFQAPVRNGLMMEYAERIARRYGDRIDYFELGNEWDLVPEAVLPENEALRLHREAYEGFAKFGVEGKLTTNGWSTDMDYGRKGGNVRNGFQRRYMQTVKDCRSVHAVHMHGPFGGFVKSVNRHLCRRKELGINMPWIANETAMSTTGGAEIEVAVTVWKKTLYAWAKGAVDYVWYNLRAAGWCSSDNEQGFGLFTADWHPRAGYPAIAGLIETFQGFDFNGALRESKGEYLFSFAGEKNGFKGLVLAGWREPREGVPQERIIRLMTDAHRGFLVDLFGNRKRQKIAEDGMVEMRLSAEPAALFLEKASKVSIIQSNGSINKEQI